MASSKDNVTCHLCPEGVFGELRPTAPYAAVASTDFTYTGQRDLPGTGLMDYKARFYSPVLKRFIQPDSVIPNAANSQSWNRYSYVINNPLRLIDPTGHSWEDCKDGQSDYLCKRHKLRVGNIKAGWAAEKARQRSCPPGGCSISRRTAGSGVIGDGSGNPFIGNIGGITGGVPGPDNLLKASGDDGDNCTSIYTCVPDCSDPSWGCVSDADALHDPLTYIEAAVLGGGFVRAGFRWLVSSATINESASVASIGSNRLYQKAGFTYFQSAIYDVLEKVGVAGLVNKAVVLNQIAQEKPFVVSLFNPAKPGPGTEMEIKLLQTAQYIETTANWLGVDKIFQPSTWQWLK